MIWKNFTCNEVIAKVIGQGVAQLLYPDRFEDLDMEESVHSYYLKFFGIDFDDETIGKILSGYGMRETVNGFEYE